MSNLAAIYLIMSHLKRSKAPTPAPTSHNLNLPSTTTLSTGVTDDMEPPNKDQLWATVYPLFQHYLFNRNFTFVPPPPATLPPPSMTSITTELTYPIPFTEPPTLFSSTSTGAASDDLYTRFNHYVSYYPPPRSSTPRSLFKDKPTKIPHRGATTTAVPRKSEVSKVGKEVDMDNLADKKLKTLLLLKKIKKKKKKKKDALVPALVGAALLKKVSRPLFHAWKRPSKYWLDLKFDVDIYELLRKQLLYILAYRYMPVFMVLAAGVFPFALSFVPLLYKMWWIRRWRRRKRTKYVKVKVPVPYPKPYPVTVYKHPPLHHGYHGGGYQDPGVAVIDHHHYDNPAAGKKDDKHHSPFTIMDARPYRRRGHAHPSTNKNPVVDNRKQVQDQEVHVHIHEDDGYLPAYHHHHHTPSPSQLYTSYTNPDLQPFSTTPTYFDFEGGSDNHGQNIEILKILMENKKAGLDKLLEMWNLAKYGVAVASETASNAMWSVAGGLSTTPLPYYHGPTGYHRKRKRKKRKKPGDPLLSALSGNFTIDKTTAAKNQNE